MSADRYRTLKDETVPGTMRNSVYQHRAGSAIIRRAPVPAGDNSAIFRSKGLRDDKTAPPRMLPVFDMRGHGVHLL